MFDQELREGERRHEGESFKNSPFAACSWRFLPYWPSPQ